MGPSGIIGPAGISGAALLAESKPPPHFPKKPDFGVEVPLRDGVEAAEAKLAIEGLGEGCFDELGVAYASKPAGKTVLKSL
jgi:hypothetical protein